MHFYRLVYFEEKKICIDIPNLYFIICRYHARYEQYNIKP